MSELTQHAVGVVAIGRNEGENLRRCLESARTQSDCIVYVDSGSTDGSIEVARSLGVEVVSLDLSKPFTAARARNAGVSRLTQLLPSLEYLQVVDGDCELQPTWIATGLDVLCANPKAAAVCGRRRERFPDASVYNRLCDMEWNTQVGEADSCGGDALFRLKAFNQVRGFNDSIIAGEEPDLCLRLRQRGWTIHRIDAEMTLHDARLTRFSQWWKRMVRAGHAVAQARAMHGAAHQFSVRQTRSILEWSLLFPLAAIALAWLTYGLSLIALLAGYAWLFHRVRRHRIEQGDFPKHATLYAQFCVLGKFAQLFGISQYWINRARGRQSTIIEYKGARDNTRTLNPKAL